MDVRQLKYFVGIVDAGSFSKASQKLFVAQPSLSQQIANLEFELDAKLLLRSAQGIMPTAAGSVLYCLILYWRGGLTGERLMQAQAFMARRR